MESILYMIFVTCNLKRVTQVSFLRYKLQVLSYKIYSRVSPLGTLSKY